MKKYEYNIEYVWICIFYEYVVIYDIDYYYIMCIINIIFNFDIYYFLL